MGEYMMHTLSDAKILETLRLRKEFMCDEAKDEIIREALARILEYILDQKAVK